MNPINFEACGADPELFFKLKSGEPVSAEGLLGGSKQEPRMLPELGDGFAIQEDNVAAEFNIPACGTADAFARNIRKMMTYLNKFAKKQGLQLMVVSDVDFPEYMLQTPQAKTLGCDPDYNVWMMAQNPRPNPPQNMRTAAGHVHVSWTNPDFEQRHVVGRALDLFLGVPSIMVTERNRRRELYGKAGAVRLKPYGIEYRVLDNFWINSAVSARQVFHMVTDCLNSLNSNRMLSEEINLLGQAIQNCINDHNREMAAVLIKRFNLRTFN